MGRDALAYFSGFQQTEYDLVAKGSVGIISVHHGIFDAIIA